MIARLIRAGFAVLTVTAIIIPAIRMLLYRTSKYRMRHQTVHLRSRDGTALRGTWLRGGHDSLVVMAHGVTSCSHHPDIITVAEAVAEDHDVLAVDLRGHGQSAGAFDFDFKKTGQDVDAAVSWGRSCGYSRVGVVGFSLGAASAIVAASEGSPIDSIVSVSCPAGPPLRIPATDLADQWAWRGLFRLMGTRFHRPTTLGPWPNDIAHRLGQTPVLVIHAGADFLVPEAASERLYQVLPGPKHYQLAPGADHARVADLTPVRAWLSQTLWANEVVSWRDRVGGEDTRVSSTGVHAGRQPVWGR